MARGWLGAREIFFQHVGNDKNAMPTPADAMYSHSFPDGHEQKKDTIED